MKKLIFCAFAAFSGLVAFQGNAQQSSLVTELNNIQDDVTKWAGDNPKSINALGLGAVGGGLCGASKIVGKRPFKRRMMRGSVFGALTSVIVYPISEAVLQQGQKEAKAKNNPKIMDELAYRAGLAAAAVVALIFG